MPIGSDSAICSRSSGASGWALPSSAMRMRVRSSAFSASLCPPRGGVGVLLGCEPCAIHSISTPEYASSIDR